MTDITIGEVRSRIIAAPWEDRPGGRGRTAYSFNSYPRPRLPRLCVSPLSFPAHVLRFVVFGGAFVCIFLHLVPLLPRLCRMIAIRKRIKIGPSRSWKLSKGWGLPNVGLNYREMLPLTWGVRPRAVPAPNMQNPELSPDSSARTLDFVCVPHLNRQPLAAAAGIKREREARGRTQEQVREGVRNPERHHKGMVEKIGIMSPQSSYRLGDCRQPVYSAPTLAYESHYMRTLVSGCRIRVNGWAIDSAHSGRRAYWEVASRSADRARRRWLWELAIAKTVGGGAIRRKKGGTS